MLPMPRVCLRMMPYFLGFAALLAGAVPTAADPKPLSKEEQAKVDKAIDKGVAFLKRIQQEKGNWPPYMRSRYPLGQTLLPAYALLESGVPASDPAIQKAAEYIRPRVLKLDWTYEVSLAVLFLDRLGDPKDKELIRSLSLRLIASQHVTGGWNYRCFTSSKAQEDALEKALVELNKRQEAGETAGAKFTEELRLPRSLSALAVFHDPRKLPWREPGPVGESKTIFNVNVTGSTDNSNTQFALLALWAARRHDVSVSPSFRLLVERFEKTQLSYGWWSYFYEDSEDPHWIKRRPSMVCVGLMGLAIGRGLKLSAGTPPQQREADLRILKSLAALSQDIGVAAANLEQDTVTRGTYFLWSLERVAMLYDLPAIGDKDWYRWGAGILLTSQKPDGSWKDVKVNASDRMNQGPNWGLVPNIDTSFALLFLKRSHPLKELTPKLPLKGKELNQGISGRLTDGDSLGPSTTAPSKTEKPKR